MDTTYTEICRVINNYYPVKEEFTPSNQLDYVARATFQQSMADKHSAPCLKKWKLFVKHLKALISASATVERVEDLLSPSYTATVVLLEETIGKVVYTRTLVVHISLIGEFYTIYGLDKVVVKNVQDNLATAFEPVLFPSPVSVYEALFPILREEIERYYTGYKFVNHYLTQCRIKGLSIGAATRDGLPPTVFQALFTPQDISWFKVVGDPFYE